MADEVRDRGMLETVFGAMEKPGAATRSTLYNMFADESNAPAVSDIMQGRATFGARDFINKFEDATGFDITAGGRDPEDQTVVDGAINIIRDIAVDIATSPESYIPFAGFAKMAGITKRTVGNPLLRRALRTEGKALAASGKQLRSKGANVLAKSLANPKVQDRIITGTSLGALSINEEDSLISSALKLSGGAALGGGATKAFNLAGAGAQKFGGKVVNSMLDSLAKNTFDKVNLDPTKNKIIQQFFDGKVNISNVFESTKKSGDEIKEMSRLFLDKHVGLEEDLVKQMLGEGFNPEQIQKQLNRIEEIKGGAFSDSVSIREKLKAFFKGKQHDGLLDESVQTGAAATNIANKLIHAKFIGRDITEKAFKQGRRRVKSDNILSSNELRQLEGIQDPTIQSLIKADSQKNIIGTMDITKDPLMNSALRKIVDTNRSTIENLTRRFKGSGRDKLIFPGFDFYAVDLKKVDDVMEENLRFAVKEGAPRRHSDKISVAGDKETREFARDLGALRFASHSLTKPQLLARKVLGSVYEEINSASLKKALAGVRNKDATALMKLAFKSHGGLLSLIKTNHLVSSTNWIKNNYYDNVFKAYMAGGVGNAIEAAVDIPAGLTKKLAKKLGVIEDVKNAEAFKNFSGGNLFEEILSSGKPNQMRKIINHDNKFMKAAADLGVIERGGRVINVNKDVITDLHLMEGLNNPTALMSKGKVDTVKLTAKKNANALEAYTTAMWNGPVARIGSSMEDSTRMITWKNVMKSYKKEYKVFEEALEIVGGDPTKIIQKTNKDFINSFKNEVFTKKEIPAMLKESIEETTEAMGRKLTKEEVETVARTKMAEFNAANGKEFRRLLKESKTDKLLEARKLMEKAAKITDNAFFDYSDVTAFDQFFMKQIFPYWTYLSKSMGYTVDKLFDPVGLQRIMGFNKIRANLGRRPTPEERLGMEQFLIDKDARITHDGKSTVNTPNFSVLDTLSALNPNEVLNRVSPILKTAAALPLNKNFFTGRTLVPDSTTPKKRVFEGKETLLPEVAEGLVNFLAPGTLEDDAILNAMSIFRNDAGSLYTNSPGIMRAIEITKNLLPFPALDAFARSLRNTLHREDKSDDYIKNSKKFTKEIIKELALPAQVRPLDLDTLRKRSETGARNVKKFNATTADELFKRKRRRKKMKTIKRRKRRKVL